MALVSPGVEIKEIDRSVYIAAQSTSIGAYAGHFNWGPVGVPGIVSTESELRSEYGAPGLLARDATYYDAFARSFYTASSFLNYGNTLRISRAVEQPFRYSGKVDEPTDGPAIDDNGGLRALTVGEPLATNTSFVGANNSYYITPGSGLLAPGAQADGVTEWGLASAGTAEEDPLDPSYTGVAVPRAAISSQEDLDEFGLTDAIYARYPGNLGDGLEIWFIDESAHDLTIIEGGETISWWKSSAAPQGATEILQAAGHKPDQTEWASNVTSNATGVKDEIHVVVVDRKGTFSGGQAGTILEAFRGMSTATNSLNSYGEPNYFRNVVNSNSKYIWIDTITGEASPSQEIVADTTTFVNTYDIGAATDVEPKVLNFGSNGGYSHHDVIDALEIFSDTATLDLNLLWAENFRDIADQALIDLELKTIVENRKDAVAFISAPLEVADRSSTEIKRNKILDKFQNIGSSSYLIFDSTPGYVYNKDRDKSLWIPLCGHMAGLCAYTDSVAFPWFSPAGLNRGNIKGIQKIAYNPGQSDRDELYLNRINPIVSYPGQGIVLYGDKTGQTKPSAFDRINVRRLFLVIEKAIADYAKYSLFEQNDEFTRSSFVNTVVPYLRDVQAKRGITRFQVICDESNNTPEIIDSNRLVASIIVNPTRSINFITLNFVATRTGASFTEIVGTL